MLTSISKQDNRGQQTPTSTVILDRSQSNHPRHSSIDVSANTSISSPVSRITPTKMSTKFPLLDTLGINSNFDEVENVKKIEQLLAELVTLHRDNKK